MLRGYFVYLDDQGPGSIMPQPQLTERKMLIIRLLLPMDEGRTWMKGRACTMLVMNSSRGKLTIAEVGKAANVYGALE